MDADETVPLASLGNVALPRITLQQAVRDGKEDVLRAWLGRLANSSKKKQALNAKDSYGFTAMHYAARFNRFKIMSLLIAEEADPEALTDEGLTPLHYAARYTPLSQNDKEDDAAAPVTLRSNSRQIMELLVKICRVNVNVKDEYGSTPLHLACSRGNRAAVEVLLACETIDVNIPDVNLDTPLHDACLFGDAFIVEKLLENEADCLLANSDKDLPIHIACQEGLCDIVNQIMRRRFDQRANMLNMPDHEMNYPLHLACESGNAEIVKVLFLNGADPNITDNKGVTPLHVAAKEGFIDIAEVLLQYENADINVVDLDLMTPLHYAARHNKLEMMKFLLRKGADIQSQDRDSHTPLLKSVVYGNLPITDLLIKEGANPDDVDREGKSMVFIAAQENQSEILDCLISGVHEDLGRELVNTTDGTQNAPLHVACEKGNIESVKILLSCDRIKVDARNEADYTPLHLAAENGHSKIVKELCEYSLKKGMDIVKDEDDESNTPLHLACLNCHHKTAQVLIKFGAEHDARNGRLWTPLDCAAFVGKTKIVELLIRNEADIDSKDKKNMTPLLLAAQEGHAKAVKLLLEKGANVATCNNTGMNALDIAIEAGQKDVAMVIVNSKQWQAALRNVTETSTGFTTPMRRLIQRMPDVAETVFNRCMTTNEDEVTEDDPEFRVTFNYEFLEDFRVHKDYFRRRATWRQPPVPARQGSSTSLLDDQNIDNDDSNVGYQTTWGPEKYSRKDHCLHIMTHSKNQDLLKHPLPASLLNYKWVKYGQLAYMANVGIQFVFVLLLTTFAFLLQSPITSLCARVNSGNFSGNIDECAAEGTEDVTNGRLIITPVVGVLVIIIAIIKLNFEAAQMLKDFLNYFKDWINYLELILFCFTIIFAFIFVNPCFCPTSWQWQFGAVAMFLGWIDLIIIIRKFPVTGIYVVMFMNIFYIFLKLVFLAILLILAFGISFYMVFHIPLNIENRIRTPFQDLGRSLMKTMTMTTGEFEYDSIFRQEGDMPDVPDLEFPAVSYILWILFIILMPILLTNLLVGLAVDDIKGMQQSAAISRLALRVELTLTLEEYIPLPLRKKMIIGHMTIKPNRKLKFFDFIRYRILGVFRFDSDQNINQYIHPIPTPLEQMKKQNEFLSDKVENLKKTMNTLIDQNEKMMATITMIAEGQGMIVESTEKPTLI